MSAPMSDPPMATLSIDGKEITVPQGTLIIRAAEDLGIEIPRFCDHPLLEPVAACRQCYVKVEGQRKLMTSCSTPVADGMAVLTQFTDEEVRKAQASVLEFLLLNHPLDCPVCDRGGECPLQDQALAYGPGESRYTEAKRTYRKPLALSPLVALDRERCVLCARCTRFCDEISGDRFIELFDRGAAEQVSIAPGEDFRSPFSGNTIQICPVGALTARPYRFSARPFDLRSADSVCPHCAAGCNLRVDLRRGEVVRHLARENAEVNEAWLCDKGRFAFRFPDAVNRLSTPLLREQGGLEPVSFREAFRAIAEWTKDRSVALLAGGRLSDEDAYALSKLARVAFGTNDLDHRQVGGLDVPLELEAAQASGMPVTYADVEGASVLVLIGLDAEQELPILHLRIRKAARKGARVFVVHPRRTRLRDVGQHVLVRPEEIADLPARMDRAEEGSTLLDLRTELEGSGGRAVVLIGPRAGEWAGAVGAALEVADRYEAAFAYLCRRAGDRGALKAGVHPALLPGGRAVEDDAERAKVEVAWGTLLSRQRGRDTSGILQAAARGEIDVLFLAGVDPLRDFPDAALARRALENTRYKVVVEASADAMSIYADAMLPAAPYVEKDGHYSDWEGRAQRFRPVRDPVGLARADWEIFQELSEVIGRDLGFRSLERLREEMGGLLHNERATPELAPSRAGPVRPDGPPSGEGAAGLVLFTYPLLVDQGVLSIGAEELKAALQQEPFLEMHRMDAERLGVADGGTVRVRTAAGEAELGARVTEDVAPGSCFVPYNQPGLAANSLLSGRLFTAADLEPVAPTEARESALTEVRA